MLNNEQSSIKQLTIMKTLVNTRNFPVFFDGLFSKEFNPNFVAHTQSGLPTQGTPAVNIIENETGFRLEVAAPGLQKEDFKLKLDNNILTVLANIETQATETTDKYTLKEFGFASFNRSFTLPNTIDSEQINANYNNGILKIDLPKKEDAKKHPRAIKVV
jgi:HSP20 family protein